MIVKTIGLIYSTKGKQLFADDDYFGASSCFDFSSRYLIESGDTNNYYTDIIEKAWCQILSGDYQVANSTLSDLYSNEMPSYIRSGLFNAYSTLYSLQGDYEKSISYRKRQMALDAPGNIDISDYYSLVNDYLHICVDSALVYSRLMIEKADTSDIYYPYYYKLYASALNSANRSSEAYSTLENAWSLFEATSEAVAKKDIIALDKKYNYSEMKRVADKERYFKNMILVILCAFVAISSLVLVLIIKSRQHAIKMVEMEKNRRADSEIINKLLYVSCRVLPETFKLANSTNNSLYQYSQTDYQKTKNKISSLEKQYKKGLSSIIDENIDSTNRSGQEKAVSFLLSKGYSRKEISVILHTSEDGIRSIISKISHKKD